MQVRVSEMREYCLIIYPVEFKLQTKMVCWSFVSGRMLINCSGLEY